MKNTWVETKEAAESRARGPIYKIPSAVDRPFKVITSAHSEHLEAALNRAAQDGYTEIASFSSQILYSEKDDKDYLHFTAILRFKND